MSSNPDDRPAPIPTYAEAIVSAGMHGLGPLPSPSTFDPMSPMGEAFYAPESEQRALLHRAHQRTDSSATNGSRRRAARARYTGYRPPTVETDGEDSTWSSSDDDSDDHDGGGGGGGAGGNNDDDDDIDAEAAHVRREMLEFDMEDPLDNSAAGGRRQGRPSIFGKGFSLSLLPRWASTWRLSMPRLRIQLPSGPEAAGDDGTRSSPPSLASRFGRLAGFTRVNTSDAENPDSAGSNNSNNNNNENGSGETTRRWSWLLRRPERPEWLGQMNKAAAIILFARVFAVVMVLGFVYLLFMSDMFSSLSHRLGSQVFDPESVRMHIQMNVDPQRMRDLSRHFTGYAHMAGTEGDFALALDVKNLFEKYGLEEVAVDEYYVYLNYPRKDGRAVEIVDVGADSNGNGNVTWSARLEEDGEPGGETAGHQTYAFHGLSKAGDVRGPLIYANYGSRDDFQRLKDSGIATDGAIALVRYAGTQADHALKVKAAELAGFAGCLVYSDPQDDGFVRGEVAPQGPYMPADGVQRGSVALRSHVIGDVLTPGWESTKGLPRLTPEKAAGLVKIPSLPLAWRDAQVLLQQLRGAGQRVPDASWVGGVPDVGEWWTGNKTASPVVRLRNEQDEETHQPVWNVYGRIVGVEQSAKKIFIGNHRDAWSPGASDPHSGTAVMLEMARIFGDLLNRGWRPLRTIEFMSWDAAAYNLVGSTEYVEKNLDALRSDGIAYLNLDAAVTGGTFHAAGSPVFSKLLNQVMKRVSDPHANASLHDLWERHQSTLEVLGGAGSDYAAFQDLAGVSSLDLRFAGPGAPTHSSYDTFGWMDHVADPGFVYHGMLGQVVGLLLIELADRPIMPFDLTAYGQAIAQWTKDLVQWVQMRVDDAARTTLGGSLGQLQQASEVVAAAVREFDRWDLKWESQVLAAGGWESTRLGQQRVEYITRMADFDASLLDLESGGGFKHVVHGPQLWSGYEGDLFPAVKDLVNAGDWAKANQTVAKIARIFEEAAAQLLE